MRILHSAGWKKTDKQKSLRITMFSGFFCLRTENIQKNR